MNAIVVHGLQPDQTRALRDLVSLEGRRIDEAATPEDLPGLVRRDPLAVDAVVLGSGAPDPTRLLQRVHALDPDIAIVLLSEPSGRASLLGMLRFAPFIGPDVEVCSNDDPSARTAVGEAAGRTRLRRRNRSLADSLNARLAEGGPSLPRPAQYLDRLLDTAPVGIVAVDGRGRIVAWNPQAGRIFGRAAAEALGLELPLLFPPAERERLEGHLAACAREPTRAIPATLEWVAPDGDPRFVRLTLTGISSRANEPGALALFEDVTDVVLAGRERDRAERELQELNSTLERRVEERTAELSRVNRELEERNAEQETFVYTVSHDLRSPLLSLHGMAGLLREAIASGDAEAASAYLGRVTANVDRMGQLLNDLLTLSRAGRSPEGRGPVELGEVARETLTELDGALSARGVQVRLPAEWPMVVYDRSALYQVFANLLGNAAKFAGRAGRPGAIAVSVVVGGSWAELSVDDDGPGVPARYRERVFELFAKLDARSVGTGVGLAIVKRIVERHGGRVWVEDSPLGGARFTATLPLA